MMLDIAICLASVLVMAFLLLGLGLLAGWVLRRLDSKHAEWCLLVFVLCLPLVGCDQSASQRLAQTCAPLTMAILLYDGPVVARTPEGIVVTTSSGAARRMHGMSHAGDLFPAIVLNRPASTTQIAGLSTDVLVTTRCCPWTPGTGAPMDMTSPLNLGHVQCAPSPVWRVGSVS